MTVIAMKLYKQNLLSPAQLQRLAQHRYSCQSISILDKFLQPYWNWLVLKIPLWIAPNLLTVLGLVVNIVTTSVLIWYSPDARTQPPRWTCALCAVGLFFYQSIDAIDGKQARRTGSTTPLGELIDHGCDAVSTIFITLSACIATQFGHYPAWMFAQSFCALILFYCAHWRTYVSGVLRFAIVDVTEMQCTVMGILAVTTVFGPDMWQNKILNVELKLVPTITAGIIGLVVAQSNLVAICTGGVGKNGSTVAGTSVLSPVIPLSLVVVPAFIIYQKSTQGIFQNHPVLYIVAFGFVAAKLTNKLVVAHMTKSEMDYTDWSLLGPAMLFLNQYFDTWIEEYYVLWGCMIWVVVDLIRYCAQVWQEISEYLHVELFTIPARSAQTTATRSTQVELTKRHEKNSRIVKNTKTATQSVE